MASSYRSNLNRGWLPQVEKPLEAAVAEMEKACELLGECTSDQIDNAEDDGALKEKLRIARDLIIYELPVHRRFKC